MRDDYSAKPEEAIHLIVGAAEYLLGMEHDFDETVTMALTRRDIIFLGAAAPALSLAIAELEPMSSDFQERLVELVKVQKPDWLAGS